MTNEVIINPLDTESIGFAPLGEVFSSARNAKKLALKDVSNNLRLSVKQIEALENNDFSILPQAVITRGFIRNYARLLELDAEPLLASYRARMPESIPSTLSVKTSMNQVMSSKGTSTSSYKYIFLMIASLAVLSVASWFYYTNYLQKTSQKNEASIANTSVETPTETPALPEVALPAAERMPQEAEVIDSGAAAEVPVASVNKVKETANQSNPSMVTTSNATNSAKVEQAHQSPVSDSNVITQNLPLPKEAAIDFNTLKEKAAQKAQLPDVASAADAKVPSSSVKAPELAKSGLKADSSIAAIKGVNIAVSEQTWVRVTDKSGAVVYEKMLQANSEDGFNGLPPFKMLIGNAKATKLTYLGQDVDLANKTRNNVARLTLE